MLREQRLEQRVLRAGKGISNRYSLPDESVLHVFGQEQVRPESSQEHLPTSIAGVLRLRAIKPSVCDRTAKRFAQDDGFVVSFRSG
jgi:hypothetical protein